MALKLAHICLGSPDLNRSREFYCDILGLRKKFDFIKNGELFGFYLELADETFIEVFKGEVAKVDGYPLRHFCLETDDIDKVARRLQEGGYPPTEKKLGADQSWQIWVESPEGLRFEFHQYTAESSQRTGRECVVDW
jgi:catechol 2,3-dioxygenase-like lactoylglutathione lyase family enzyme